MTAAAPGARDPLATPRDESAFYAYSMGRGIGFGIIYAVAYAVFISAMMFGGPDGDTGERGSALGIVVIALVLGIPSGFVIGLLLGLVAAIVVDRAHSHPARTAAWAVRLAIFGVAAAFSLVAWRHVRTDIGMLFYVAGPFVFTWLEAGRHARRVVARKERSSGRPDRRVPVV